MSCAHYLCIVETRMKQSLLKAVLIALVSVHLGGPFFETVDRWDDFKFGNGDIAMNVATAASLLAAAICLGMAMFQALRRRIAFRRLLGSLAHVILPSCPIGVPKLPLTYHSPPVHLRI